MWELEVATSLTVDGYCLSEICLASSCLSDFALGCSDDLCVYLAMALSSCALSPFSLAPVLSPGRQR